MASIIRFVILACFTLALPCLAAPKSVRVFVALCDNKTQGIAPVPQKIGDGDKPDENLYWGCSEGFRSWFKRSARWKVTRSETNVSADILARLTCEHVSGQIVLTAEAYRGSAIRKCLEDFERCVAAGQCDLVAYIGHNGLMDFSLSEVEPLKGNDAESERRKKNDGDIGSPQNGLTDVIVLCCKSNAYFSPRLRRLNARPILLAEQFMYPGSFVLHDAMEAWYRGGSLSEIRSAAGEAYAKNQKISVKAATRVFSKLEEDKK